MNYSKNNLGLYFHIPFCVKKCKYCDFYSVDNYSQETVSQYGEKLLFLLDKFKDNSDSYKLVSIYFGGGTPSNIGASWINKSLEYIARYTDISNIEISLELNPGDADQFFLDQILKSGVNRISVGVQSADDETLKLVGRRYNKKTLKNQIISVAERFDNFSCDFIYGIGSPERNMKDELDFVFDIATPKHISAYAYTKPERIDAPPQICADTTASQEELICSYLKQKGIHRYEVSNFATPGFECRHNLIYWSWESYLGLGAGAHSFFPEKLERVFYDEDVKLFIKQPVTLRRRLEKDEAVKEYLMMALRKTEGFNLNNFENEFSFKIEEVLGTKLKELIEKELINITSYNFYATEKGLSALNDLTILIFDAVDIFFSDKI